VQAGTARAKQGIGQEQQPRWTMEDRQKNPAEHKSPQEHGNVTITFQLTHDPTKNAKTSLQGMARAPLGERYEQVGAARVEQEMGQKQQPHPGKKFSTEHIAAETQKCKLQDPNTRAGKQPTRRPLCSKQHGRE